MNSFYSFLLLVVFSVTCISCSHSGVRSSEADLSDEAVTETASSGEEAVTAPVTLMSESEGTSSDSSLAEEKAPAEQGAELAQAEITSGNDSNSSGGTESQSETSLTANTEPSTETATLESGASFENSEVVEKKVERMIAAPKPRKLDKPKNWQKIERKPSAKLSPSEEDSVVQSEIEKAMNRDTLAAPEVARKMDEVPAVALKEDEDPKLASVEVSSFAQRHGWLVAFAAAGLIIFLFFTLTRNRAKKDMSL